MLRLEAKFLEGHLEAKGVAACAREAHEGHAEDMRTVCKHDRVNKGFYELAELREGRNLQRECDHRWDEANLRRRKTLPYVKADAGVERERVGHHGIHLTFRECHVAHRRTVPFPQRP